MRKLFLISTFGLFIRSTAVADTGPFADNWYCIETVIFSSTNAHLPETEDDSLVEQIAVNDFRTYSRTLVPIRLDWVDPRSELFGYLAEETSGWWMTDDEARSSDSDALWHYPPFKKVVSSDAQNASLGSDSVNLVRPDSRGVVPPRLPGATQLTATRDGHRDPLSKLDRWLIASSYIWHTDKLSFGSAAARLRRGGYRIIGHGLWLQPVPDRSAAVPLLVQLGEQGDSGLYEVEGTISATRGRYLHVDVRLWMNAPGPLIGQEHSFVELRDSRRMRSGEVHYLDHPALGMLVKIVPVDVPELVRDILESSGSATDDVEEGSGVVLDSEVDLMMLDWSVAATCSRIYD